MAGAITAALFLKNFTNNHAQFLHFDIFGWNQKNRPGKSYGGLMQGARSLAVAIEKMIENKTAIYNLKQDQRSLNKIGSGEKLSKVDLTNLPKYISSNK